MKKSGISILLTFFSLMASLQLATAQEGAVATSKAPSSMLDWAYQNIVLVVGVMAILGAIAALVYLNNMLMQVQRIRILQEHGLEVAEKLAITQQQPFWQRMYKQMTKAVPIEKESDVMLDHNYDGIRELDNILPPWWVGMFYATIVFGVGYFVYFHMTDYGYSSQQEYTWAVEQADKDVKAFLATQADMVDENTVTLLADADALEKGKSIFEGKCAVCHGTLGEGGVGPNMADNYWLHGGDIQSVFKTVKYGVPEKGMISWKAQLRPVEMQQVSSYILNSITGTTPPNPKEPQGELFVPQSGDTAAPATDSTAVEAVPGSATSESE